MLPEKVIGQIRRAWRHLPGRRPSPIAKEWIDMDTKRWTAKWTFQLSNKTSISQEKNNYEVLDPLHVAADSLQPPSIGRPPVPNVNACFTIRPWGFSGGMECGLRTRHLLGGAGQKLLSWENPLKQTEQKLCNYDYRSTCGWNCTSK